jgi:hypothetical protein
VTQVIPDPEIFAPVDLCLRIDDDLLATVNEWLGCESNTVIREKSETFLWVTTTVTPELVERLRSMGPKVEVMLPLSLREHMRTSLAQALFQYRLA